MFLAETPTEEAAMRCPRCETTTLDEKDREGVVVDICAQCRGVWLDRGELEKLIARAARDLEELEQRPAPAPRQERSYPPPPERSYTEPERHYAPPRARRDSDPDYHHHGHGHDPRDPRYRRKKSLLESLGDIFD
jgi:uncharacterized protein